MPKKYREDARKPQDIRSLDRDLRPGSFRCESGTHAVNGVRFGASFAAALGNKRGKFYIASARKWREVRTALCRRICRAGLMPHRMLMFLIKHHPVRAVRSLVQTGRSDVSNSIIFVALMQFNCLIIKLTSVYFLSFFRNSNKAVNQKSALYRSSVPSEQW